MRRRLCFVSLKQSPAGRYFFAAHHSHIGCDSLLSSSVLRDGSFLQLAVEHVVPGDIISLRPGPVHCDMVIVNADRILLDESALTGEATPVFKSPIDVNMKKVAYCPLVHKANTISAGTVILEVADDGSDLALVLATGSFTTKGKVLTDILSYERHKFQFDDEVKVVLAILLCQAIVFISLIFHFLRDQWVYAWFYGKAICALGF
jgi:magnesium-transporting ATPase (P-type)